MTKSLPTIDPVSNDDLHNIEQASQIFMTLFPDMGPRVNEMLQIMSYIEQTHVNPQVLPRVVRGIHNLMIGTGYGQVILHVKGDNVNVQIRETDGDLKTTL